jgi:hypothetical protein
MLPLLRPGRVADVSENQAILNTSVNTTQVTVKNAAKACAASGDHVETDLPSFEIDNGPLSQWPVGERFQRPAWSLFSHEDVVDVPAIVAAFVRAGI